LASCISLAFAASIPLAALPAHADELSELKAQMQMMAKRLSELEAKQSAAPQAAPAAMAAPVPAALQVDQNGTPLGAEAVAGVSLYNNATTSLRMYGIVEATISHASNQNANNATTFGFQTSYFSGNRLGFDLDHVLGFGDQIGLPNLKVISKLETEFELPTGNSDTVGVLFNRDAWLGLYSEDLGKLTFGRQNTLTRDFTANWGDPFGSAEVSLKEGGYSNVNNFKQFIFYSGGATGTRVNSAIEWKKRYGQHVVAGLGYAFGSGGAGGSGDIGNGGTIPGDFTNGSTQAASIAYNGLDLGAGKLSANVSYDRAKVSDLIHQSELIGGNYVIGGFRFNAGYAHYTAQQGVNNSMGTRTDNSWTTSMSFTPGNKMEYMLGYQVMKGTHAGFGGSGNTLNPFGNTGKVTAVADGNKKTIYAAIFYHADKQTDFYIAADSFKAGGGWIVGDAQGNGNHYGLGKAFSGTFETAVGLRFKF
jgi:predicted porin